MGATGVTFVVEPALCVSREMLFQGFDYRAIDFADALGIDFQHFAVIRHQAVGLGLNIGSLSVHGGRKAERNVFLQDVGKPFILIHHTIERWQSDVTKVFFISPVMSGHRHTDAAILAQHVHAIVVAELHLGLRIVVEVQYIAGLEEIAAGSRINQACRVMALGKLCRSVWSGAPSPGCRVCRVE